MKLSNFSRQLFCFALLSVAGCGEGEVQESGDPRDTSTVTLTDSSEGVPERYFDRDFVFVSTEPDSAILVPWRFRSRVEADRILSERSVDQLRGGSWEILVEEQAETPLTRVPGRILPGEQVRLTVGEDDNVQSLLLRSPSLDLETRLDTFVSEWLRHGNEPARLFRGRMLHPSDTVGGFVLEVSESWSPPQQTPGDWMFLHAGEDVQFFMEESVPLAASRSESHYHGWSRIDLQDGRWLEIQVDWAELRPFERARRDVPLRWTWSTEGGEMSGEVTSVSSHLQVVEGEGPILPLSGFFEVSGTLVIEGHSVPVSGIIRHNQY